MHELSLAQLILGIVHDHVPNEQMHRVRAVHVQLGRLSGVVADSLEFCMSALVAETPLRSARLEIETIPLRVDCAACREIFVAEQDTFLCPRCGGSRTTVVSGTELRVSAIEIEEDPGEPACP